MDNNVAVATGTNAEFLSDCNIIVLFVIQVFFAARQLGGWDQSH